MRRINQLRRSTPFRLALTFAVLLIGAFLLSGVVVYQIMDVELKDRVDEELHKTFALLAAGYDQNDLEDLTTAVQNHADLSQDGEQLFGLWDIDGKQLAGNLTLPAGTPQGIRTVAAKHLGQNGDSRYRVLTGPIDGNTLGIAITYSETDEIRRVLLFGFAWATLIAMALAIAGGAILATRVQRRLDIIADTMNDVSQGRLAARIPLIGRQDDIDGVSGRSTLHSTVSRRSWKAFDR